MFSLESESLSPALLTAPCSRRKLNFISNERVVFMLLLSTVWTLVLTVVPVLSSLGPNDYYLPERDWYTGDDVMRFVEPVGGLLLNCIVLYQAPIFHLNPSHSESPDAGSVLGLPEHWLLLCIFAIALAIYQQGAGFHSASNMFKNALTTIIDPDNNDDVPYDSKLHTLYFYMRTVWEHDVSHYLYAVGLVIAQMCQLYAHWSRKGSDALLSHSAVQSASLPSGDDVTASRFTRVCLFFSALSYGLLIAAVAINYPAGLIVGLVYVLVLLAILFTKLMLEYRSDTDRGAFSYAHRPVVHHFLVGCLWALLFIIIWIIINGGIVQRSNSSAVST
jgi:hypothetical protein